jgi:molecular chaperone DnaK
MRREAEANAEADKKRASATESKNKAESLVWEIEKNLDTYKDIITEEEKTLIKDKLSSLRSAINTNDTDKIQQAQEEVERETRRIFSDAYKKKASQNTGSGGSGTDSGSNEGFKEK